jgi:hypothetical protein
MRLEPSALLVSILSLTWFGTWSIGLWYYPHLDFAAVYSVLELAFHCLLVSFVFSDTSIYFIMGTQILYSGFMFLLGFQWITLNAPETMGFADNKLLFGSNHLPFLVRLMYIDLHVKGGLMFLIVGIMCLLSLLWLLVLFIYIRDILKGQNSPFPNHYSLFRSRFHRLFEHRHIPKDDCSICLCPFDKHTITSVSCGHSFHSHCISEWLEHSVGYCPLCHQKFQTAIHNSSQEYVHSLIL